VVVYGQHSARNTRTDQRPTTSWASARQNILPNLPKSPSQVPILDDTPAAPVAPSTILNDTLNQFRGELSKSLEESLGVQIKPGRTTYRKPYPSHFDFMKAPDGWKVYDLMNLVVMIVNIPWIILACFSRNWVKLVLMILWKSKFFIVSYWHNFCMVYFITNLFYRFMG
jgi:hypothetical protein